MKIEGGKARLGKRAATYIHRNLSCDCLSTRDDSRISLEAEFKQYRPKSGFDIFSEIRTEF